MSAASRIFAFFTAPVFGKKAELRCAVMGAVDRTDVQAMGRVVREDIQAIGAVDRSDIQTIGQVIGCR
jgi:hypothetical protein